MKARDLSNEDLAAILRSMCATGICPSRDEKEYLREAADRLEQKPETVTEFADRCRECGAKYGKLLKQEPTDDKCHYCEHNFIPYKGNTGEFAEQQPCDKAISCEVVYQLLLNMASSAYGFEEIRRIVDELPPVTPKSGKWIETEYHRWRCLVCREKGMSEWDNIHNVRTNFCPNCGAKMESEE